MIYVASSWRNPMQIAVVAALKSAARMMQADYLLPYDFRNPTADNKGFHWSDVGMPTYDRETNGAVPTEEYLAGIEHPLAVQGFKLDYDAMEVCDTCILVLPCGRSAHLELGWFCGKGRRTAILLEHESNVPELMYKMVDYLSPSLYDLLGWLGVTD